MNGKGSTPRPITDREDFRRRWDETFKKKTNFMSHEAAVFCLSKIDRRESTAIFGPVVSPPYDR